jgi:hypothetical protein
MMELGGSDPQAEKVTSTVSVEGGQGPLAMVHTRMFTPEPSPETVALGVLALGEKVPVKFIAVLVPVPTSGVLPSSV